MFEEFLEEDRQVCRITKQDIHAFKRALSETPANYVKRFPGTTLPDAVKANKARAKSYPTLSTRTINDKYLARLHSILNWCVRSEIIPDNPATGIKVDAIKKSERPRVNFSPDDLIRLFNPKHFNTSTPFNEMQWAMIISLFSGMRASELAQMQLNSIRTERGVLVFAVEEETKTQDPKD